VPYATNFSLVPSGQCTRVATASDHMQKLKNKSGEKGEKDEYEEVWDGLVGQWYEANCELHDYPQELGWSQVAPVVEQAKDPWTGKSLDELESQEDFANDAIFDNAAFTILADSQTRKLQAPQVAAPGLPKGGGATNGQSALFGLTPAEPDLNYPSVRNRYAELVQGASWRDLIERDEFPQDWTKAFASGNAIIELACSVKKKVPSL
jgi:hypothetical protein